LAHSGPEPDNDAAVSEAAIHVKPLTRVCPFIVSTRERDTTGQLIGNIDEVISVLVDLVNGTIDWTEACKVLPAYDGIQAVD
jgi:hypothetical protein